MDETLMHTLDTSIRILTGLLGTGWFTQAVRFGLKDPSRHFENVKIIDELKSMAGDFAPNDDSNDFDTIQYKEAQRALVAIAQGSQFTFIFSWIGYAVFYRFF